MARFRTPIRFFQVAWNFLPFAIAVLRDRRRFVIFGQRSHPSPAEQERRAQKLVETLIHLGPTFIKLGQLLSTRPDVMPPVYLDQLSALQDDVPAARWADTAQLIEDSIGPIDDQFTDFDTEAISGASLGQVYRAKIDGEDVAVKVRRPGVANRVEIDVRVLQVAVPLVTRFLDEARAFSLENLADEFAKVIREEMDYERERAMLEEIRDNFAEEPAISIPQPIDGYCSERVLTMEYLRGTKITDVERLEEKGIDRTAVAERLERAYLKMVLEDGVFHADPHPGNLSVMDDGTIIFYDFGMSGRIPDETREEIVSFYLAVAERDIEGILDTLTEMGTLSPTADRQVMGEILDLAIKDAQGEKIDEWRLDQIIARVESTMYEFPLRLPARLALVMRVATVAEGVCVTLDPSFDFIAVATDFLTERGYREESIRRLLRNTGQSLGEASLATMRAAPKADRALDRFNQDRAFIRAGIDDSDGTLNRLTWRLTYALFGGAGIIAGAIIYVDAGLDTVLGIPVAITVASIVMLWRSSRGRRGLQARPSFTRQAMRERRNR